MQINIEKQINERLQARVDYIYSMTTILERAAIDLRDVQFEKCRYQKPS